jgi:hypothetical protein
MTPCVNPARMFSWYVRCRNRRIEQSGKDSARKPACVRRGPLCISSICPVGMSCWPCRYVLLGGPPSARSCSPGQPRACRAGAAPQGRPGTRIGAGRGACAAGKGSGRRPGAGQPASPWAGEPIALPVRQAGAGMGSSPLSRGDDSSRTGCAAWAAGAGTAANFDRAGSSAADRICYVTGHGH